MTLLIFHPFDLLAAKLLDNLMDDEDGAHDVSHIVRVWRNAKLIHREEGGDLEVLAAAVLLHDCVQVAKDSPLRSRASLLAANESRVRLAALGWAPLRIDTLHAQSKVIASRLGYRRRVSRAAFCKMPIAWTLSGLAALRDASTLRAVSAHVSTIWPIQRETHARWMMGETRWITFPRSC